MNEIRIVQYEPKYAASLADMWNKSGENWGGESIVRNAEIVKEEEEKAGNICAFLALDGDNVVGYCSFSNYKHDEGASYIPALNVRPDYLNQKIGKKLVLACVEVAIKSEWPRLDLYTWQGNDKAVPLYKKCGFFWEKTDEYTHLMNFLPYVMNTEAVKEYFEIIDWYQDNQRKIEIESDGRLVGGFDYYDYRWMKENVVLNMEFERRGRGLTCIETADYLIRSRVSKQNLIVDRGYKVSYELVNKSGQPLEVSIKGIDDKNIKYQFEYKSTITSKQIVMGDFYVDTVFQEQEKSKTHPCVTSVITINGKEAIFKVGINPKLPVRITIANENEYKDLEKESKYYLNIENNFASAIDIKFSLADSKYVKFLAPNVSTSMKAAELKTIAIPCVVKAYGFYNKEVDVIIGTGNDQILHRVKLRGAFRGYQGRYHGEDEKSYNIYNGAYKVSVSKKNNVTVLTKLGLNNSNVIRSTIPQLGMPYFQEFKNKRPESISFLSTEHSELMQLAFRSEKFAELIMIYCVELFQDGIINMYCEIQNNSATKNYHDISVCQGCGFEMANTYLPYGSSIVRSPNVDGVVLGLWDSKKLSENWVFSHHNARIGLGWHSKAKLSFDYNYINIESRIGEVKPLGTYRTYPIVYSLDTFEDWQEFRKYLGNTETPKGQVLKQSFECNINKGNPFLNKKCEVTFIENKKIVVEGRVLLTSMSGSFRPVNKELHFNNNKASVSIPFDKEPEIDIVTIDIDLNLKKFSRKKVVFFNGKSEVICSRYVEKGKEVLKADNGVIAIKSSPQFSAGIFSLSYKGHEWLDNSYPTPRIKAWWNYWTGGMSCLPEGLSFSSAYKEEKEAEFVDIKDNYGNQWSGLRTSLIINEQVKNKGIHIQEYYLLMKGVPVVCSFAVIYQNSGKYLQNKEFIQNTFIKEGKNLSDNWVVQYDKNEKVIYNCGEVEFDSWAKTHMVHGSINQSYKLIRLLNKNGRHDYYNTNNIAYACDIDYVSAKDGETVQLLPQFMVFSKLDLNDILLDDFRKIFFDLENQV